VPEITLKTCQVDNPISASSGTQGKLFLINVRKLFTDDPADAAIKQRL